MRMRDVEEVDFIRATKNLFARDSSQIVIQAIKRDYPVLWRRILRAFLRDFLEELYHVNE